MVTGRHSTSSTVGNLPLHTYQVHYTTLCCEVADRFEQEPSLPGVIILDNARLVGMLPRQKLVERIQYTLGADLYLHRAIVQALLHWVTVKPLDLPANCSLKDAFQKAIRRPRESCCDPIIITFENGKKSLLDFQTLLLAYSQGAISASTKSPRPLVEQQPPTTTSEISETLTFNGTHNQTVPKSSLKVDKIESVDYRFIQVGRRLSSEGKQAFQTTWEMVDAAHHNTEHLIATSKVMVKELEALRTVASLVGDISKQTRFLGWHTRILANQLGGGKEVDGFSRVLSEFTHLNEQTLEAVRCMHGTANRLRTCVEDLLKLAQGEAYLAQVLIHKVAQVKGVLTELDELLEQRNLELTPPPPGEVSKLATLQPGSKKSTTGDSKILEPDRRSEDGYLHTLIQSTEQKLQKSKKTMWRKWQQE